MSITYSGCDNYKLAYHAYQHEQKICNVIIIIMVINYNLSCAFDATCLCAICGKIGHTFEGYEELEDPIEIQKAYIQLHVALQKTKEMKAN